MVAAVLLVVSFGNFGLVDGVAAGIEGVVGSFDTPEAVTGLVLVSTSIDATAGDGCNALDVDGAEASSDSFTLEFGSADEAGR